MRSTRISRVFAFVLVLSMMGVIPATVRAQDLDDADEVAEACWPGLEPNTDDDYPQWPEAPEMIIDDSGDTQYTAVFETDEGDITVELLPGEAPATVNNFVCLAATGFYDDVTFHRVVPGFVIQGGDPTGTGRGGPGYQFEDEPIERDYETGTLAMANAGPDTNGSQFFFVLAGGANQLDSLYTIFGEVANDDSQDVVEEIGESDPDDAPVEISTIRIDVSSDDDNEDERPANVEVDGDDYQGVIIDEGNGGLFVDSLYGPGASESLEFWTPDEEDIEALETVIEDFLADEADAGHIDEDVIDDLPDYGRQYAGIIDDGDETILASFFCDSFDGDPQIEYIAVEDGGDCFFRVTYDVAGDSLSDLEVNGEA